MHININLSFALCPFIIVALLYSIQVTAQDTINEELARTISQLHYLHPPLDEVLQLNNSEINTYLQGLDPYSRYFSPEESLIYQQSVPSRVQTGLGINILGNDEELIVVPFKKGPAYAAGLKRPQYLVTLNDKKVTLKTLISEGAPQLQSGIIVPIEVSKSPSGAVKRYAVKVGVFMRPSVELIHEANADLIRIHEFRSRETAKQLKKFVNHLIKAGKKIIIDLRYSPGGSLFETLDSVSLFLPSETHLITLVDNADYQENFSAVQVKVAKNTPLYLLVSPYTASSAEVFSLILKHYSRATLIGTRTQGKCLSQQFFDFEDGSVLRLSVFNIIGPDKRSCQDVGVFPNIQFEKSHFTDTAFILDKGVGLVAKRGRFVCVVTPDLKTAEAQLTVLVSSIKEEKDKMAVIQGKESSLYACVGPFFTERAAEMNRVKLENLLGVDFQIIMPF